MKMSDDRPPLLLREEPQELFHEVAERDDLVQQGVVRQADLVVFPEEVLDLAEAAHDARRVEEDDPRRAGDEPSPVVGLDAAVAQGLDHAADRAR